MRESRPPSSPRFRCLFLLGILLAAPATVPAAGDAELEQMRRELEALKQQVSELEARLEAAEEEEGEPAPVPGAREASASDEPPPEPDVQLTDSATGAQQAQALAPPGEPEAEPITLGGALRFNAFWTDFSDANETKRGDSGLDLFRIGVNGEYEDILISAEYRWYPYMQTIHHGWVGYDFESAGQVQVGVSQVPFGILPYASHNYWFGVPYYLGLSDDYDLGAKYVRRSGPWQTDLALYKNEELGNAADLSRYSFDVARVGDQQNEETNQFNGRLAYTIGYDTDCYHEVGLSAQWGELFNAATGDSGDHWAAGAHLDSRCGRWNVQLQLARYGYDPANPAGVNSNVVRLGAFETSYDVAARGTLGVFNVAYNFPVAWESIDQITCYNDYSVLYKEPAGFDESRLNTTGCAIGFGPVFTYIDIINAQNMVFFGDGSLAGAGDDEWQTRVNLNIGYYW